MGGKKVPKFGELISRDGWMDGKQMNNRKGPLKEKY